MSVAARETVRCFSCMGGRFAVYVGGRAPDGRDPTVAALIAQAQLVALDRRLSRFAEDSELSRCNADPAPVVHASALLRRLARAAAQAGAVTDGLVDATRLDELERAGYATSRAGLASLSLDAALAAAPAPRPAGAAPDRAWRQILVDDEAATISRPPGVRIDSGGLGKGLSADVIAATLAGHASYAVDCGGDVRVGGSAGLARRILVEDPFGGSAPVHELELVDGAVATSGIARRSWRTRGGEPAHHLIDPASGRPAWTGVVQVTALAPTALEAEITAKAALLAGPVRGRELLALGGGALVLADGRVEAIATASDRAVGCAP